MAAIKYLNAIDLNQNELQNPRAQNLGTAPSSPVAGQFYFDTGAGRFQGWNGSAWESLDNSTAAELLALIITVDGSGSLLDADFLDGQSSAYFLARANHTGTQLANTVSDFDTQVRTSRLDQMAVPTASVSMNSQLLTSVLAPVSATDAANKAYVDAVSAGQDVKASCRLATAAALPANTRTGNVLTATALGALTVDGVAVALNDRILVKDEALGANNGIYTVTTLGTAGVAFVLTRATDADVDAEVTSGQFTFIEEGTANDNAGWQLTTNNPIVVNTTALVYTIYSRAADLVAGAGMTQSGSTFNVIGTADRITANADSIDIASTYVGQTSIITLGAVTTGTWSATAIAVAKGGTGATTAPAARTALGALGKYSALIGDGSATSIAITQATHGLAADGTNTVAVYDASTGAQVYPGVAVTPASGTVTLTFTVAPTTNQYRVVIQGLT